MREKKARLDRIIPQLLPQVADVQSKVLRALSVVSVPHLFDQLRMTDDLSRAHGQRDEQAKLRGREREHPAALGREVCVNIDEEIAGPTASWLARGAVRAARSQRSAETRRKLAPGERRQEHAIGAGLQIENGGALIALRADHKQRS